MPELLVDFITSLDGYAAADGWPGWWGLEGPEYLGWLGQQPERDHTILMGATTYRLMSGFAADAKASTDEATDEDAATTALANLAQGGVLLDTAGTAVVVQHRARQRRRRRSRGRDEARRGPPDAHARQCHPVPVAAGGGPR